MRKRLIAGFLASWIGATQAQNLPEPLTLEGALASVTQVPEVLRAQSLAQQAQAAYAQKQSEDHWSASMQAEMAWREFKNDIEDNHSAYLSLSKPLYRFGRAYADEQFYTAEVALAEQLRTQAQQFARLKVMQTYWAVVNADLQYRVANEAMAVAYVTWDKVVERHKLQQVSDADLAQAEAIYQPYAVEFARAGIEQRVAREQLAAALGYPGQLSSEVVRPASAPLLERLNQLPEQPTPWIEQAMEKHPDRLILQARVQKLQAQLAQVRTRLQPQLDLGIKVGAQTDMQSREGNWKAGVSLNVPLHDGGKQSAELAFVQAQLKEIEAQDTQLMRDIRLALVESWAQLHRLKRQLAADDANARLSELYMDRNRALYEFEWAADLGDAMVKMSQVALQQNETLRQVSLAFERVDYALGGHGK